jgi:hypothetical protein
MKIIKFILLSTFLLLYFPSAYAIIHPNQTHTQSKYIKKVQKSKRNFSKKGDFDFSHPVKKWLWLTLLLALVSAVLQVMRLGGLAYICWVGAGICLIIWVLKFAQIL